MGEMELVGGLVEIMGCCCGGKINKGSTTTVRKVVAINFYHEQFVGLPVPMSDPLMIYVMQGVSREHT